MRPPRPKGRGMLRAARPVFRISEITSRSCPDPFGLHNWTSAFGFQKRWFIDLREHQKMCEGSLHPRPEGRGIRDPPRSQCNKKLIYPLVTEQTISRNWFPPTAHFICHLFAPSGIKNMCLAFPAFMLLAE